MTSPRQFAVRIACALLASFGTALAVATPASAQFCEPWNGGADIRCLSHVSVDEWTGDIVGGVNPILATVTVQNRGGSDPVEFTYQLWNSICNISGTGEPEAKATLQAGASFHIDLHPRHYAVSSGGTATDVPHQGGGLSFATVLHPFVCTEYFFSACTAAGSTVHCTDVLAASVVEFPDGP